ncbi:carbohydrate ABC transporter substrate-binding protein [Rhizobium laguerreae]|uniref:ABC transporter substrate-binding protein n=1 Tax=Rhizobium laguerreae TaxID=1076926 RepID=UPI001C913C9F|nr:ABC transporter substrate-binding protein [Rhizobium laguerreae]MBY3308187.1 carbohydrate ABC transporter substrate-binding protein [Rhizobium laguerreae]
MTLRNKLQAAAIMLLMSSIGAHAEQKTLVVWDFKSSDPLIKPYFDYVRDEFQKQHPDVTIKQIAQPADSYYTVLGTAINARQGPDVALLHSGNMSLDRADAFVNLKEQVADVVPNLAGLTGFTRKDGGYVALPLTVQGAVFYINNEVYKNAGLDPNKPPQTWEEWKSVCDAVKSKTEASCLTLGNKDGVDFINLMSAVADGAWSKDTRAKFIAHDLSWTSPEMKAVFAKLKEMIDAGWLEKGANSYSPYTDAVNIFAGARTAHVLGLISDAPNAWKNLEALTGEGEVSVALPVAIDHSPQAKADRLEVDGGIGFGVTQWSANKDLAVEYIKLAVSPDAAAVLVDAAGGLPSNTKVDVSKISSPAAKQVIQLLECCKDERRIKSFVGVAERKELQRLGQLLLTGDATVDQTLESVERVRQAEIARAK